MTLARVTTVMDTVETLRSAAEAPALAHQVRQLYQAQGLAVDEAVLGQAVALCHSATAVSPAPSPPEQNAQPRNVMAALIPWGVVLLLVGFAAYPIHRISTEFEATNRVVAGALDAPHRTDQLAAASFQQSLHTLGLTARSLPPLSPERSVGIEIAHANPTLVQRLLEKLPPLVDFRINGQAVHNFDETHRTLDQCRDDAHCDVADLTLTLQDAP